MGLGIRSGGGGGGGGANEFNDAFDSDQGMRVLQTRCMSPYLTWTAMYHHCGVAVNLLGPAPL